MTTKIFGPPGTGKTTRLLKEMESAFIDGVTPSEVGFFSFTNQAAMEARTRAMNKFPQFPHKDFHSFRTLHSLAYRLLGGAKSKPCMNFYDWKNFSKVVGFPMTGNASRLWDDTPNRDNITKGDRLRAWVDLARLKGVSLEEIWKKASIDNIGIFELRHFSKTLENFKKANGVLDFCDMLEMATNVEEFPKFKVLFIDEAQDLSALQWNFVDRLVYNAERTFVAGDDDQAIFTWAGADVERFKGFPGEHEVLGITYRLPQVIHNLAQTMRKRITGSVPKTWRSKIIHGSVKYHNRFNTSSINLREGTWLLLVRNNSMLQPLADALKKEGHFFESRGEIGLPRGVVLAIHSWERLRNGKSISMSDAVNMYEFMRAHRGVKMGGKTDLKKAEGELTLERLEAEFGLLRTKEDIWHVALDLLPRETANYIIHCLKNGEKILREPRIRLTTIHGAKGSEADNVFIFTDMSRKTNDTYRKNVADEFRVWYVAVTRAKQNLHICHPQTLCCFSPLLSL